jgi:hypothetical protein
MIMIDWWWLIPAVLLGAMVGTFASALAMASRNLRTSGRMTADAMTAYVERLVPTRCQCGHDREVHAHYRDGSDCGRCGHTVCPEFRPV